MRERRQSHRGLTEVTVWVPTGKVEAVRTYARRIGQRRAPPDREQIVACLRQHRAILVARFGVASLALFGSAARGDAKAHSDVDLLVRYGPGHPSGSFEFVELKNHLEGLLGRPVDLTTAANLKPRLRSTIMNEAVIIY